MYRQSIGLFYNRAYLLMFKKIACSFAWVYRTFSKLLWSHDLSIVRIIGRYCYTPFQSNIQFTLILLLLLILDNDVHQNPGSHISELSIFHLNARIVRNKIEYIENIASEASIISITESHLDGIVSDHDIYIEGFSEHLFRKDRNCFCGGVLVYTSQDICVKQRQDLNFTSGEIIWYEILIPNFKLLICTVY